MANTKRKRVSDSTDPPAKKQRRSRRAEKQTTIPVINVHADKSASPVRVGGRTQRKAAPKAKKLDVVTLVSSEEDEEEEHAKVVPKKKKKVAKKLAKSSDSDSDVDASPSPKRIKKKPKATTVDSASDSDASDAIGSPRKPRRIQRKVESDDEDDAEAQPRRLTRVRTSSPPPVDDEESASAPPGRLHRKSSLELDSDDDPEDLKLPDRPVSTKPTKKDVRSSALARYAKARKNKSSPTPVPADAASDDDDREYTPFSDAEQDKEGLPDVAEEDEPLEDDAQDENDTFIVDDNDNDANADEDANAVLNRMRYSSRQLDEHFAVFVEYVIALDSDPEYLSTASEDEKEYFATAVKALRRHIDPLADSMTLSTWKAPFIATLNLRPVLADGMSTDATGDCHACWTRGMYACDQSGAYVLSTQKGVYDRDTFMDKPEKGIKYGKATRFENNAEARNLPYPPGFELVIGQRCFNRAMAYHDARHYMHTIALRVREKIESLSEDNEELANDPNALLEAMKEEHFIEYLWGQFKSDKKQWALWANRKDQDTLG
ncbi:DUF4211 domain-containing protein [Favolaschia claudopus]|uniref:DUF4211 domain-containing protein n=1 Tax=Favolaschia claudopus TaxID=2862362 RepID=A0AAW0AC79_9AGAR